MPVTGSHLPPFSQRHTCHGLRCSVKPLELCTSGGQVQFRSDRIIINLAPVTRAATVPETLILAWPNSPRYSHGHRNHQDSRGHRGRPSGPVDTCSPTRHSPPDSRHTSRSSQGRRSLQRILRDSLLPDTSSRDVLHSYIFRLKSNLSYSCPLKH